MICCIGAKQPPVVGMRTLLNSEWKQGLSNNSWWRSWVTILLIIYENLSSGLNVSWLFFFQYFGRIYFHKGCLLKSCMFLGMKYSIIAWRYVYSNSCSFPFICIPLFFFFFFLSYNYLSLRPFLNGRDKTYQVLNSSPMKSLIWYILIVGCSSKYLLLYVNEWQNLWLFTFIDFLKSNFLKMLKNNNNK